MHITLINPPNNSFFTELPYGLGVLKAYLKSRNVTAQIYDIDIQVKKNAEIFRTPIRNMLRTFIWTQRRKGLFDGIDVAEHNMLAEELLFGISLEATDLVGIGVTSGRQFLTALLLAEKITRSYAIPVVMGGIHITAFAERIFNDFPFINYIISGPGEEPLLSLGEAVIGRRHVQDVPSLLYRNAGTIKQTKPYNYDIEEQLVPEYEDLPMHLYSRNILGHRNALKIPYVTSRGCLNKCPFCLERIVEGDRWQAKSPQKVVSDIRILKEKYSDPTRPSYISFDDANINFSYAHIDRLCDAMIEAKLNIKWIARGTNVLNVDKKLLKKMRDSGCQYLRWGVESASKAMLTKMEKSDQYQKTKTVLECAASFGIKNYLYLLTLYPYETAADIRATRRLIQKCAKHIYEVYLVNLVIWHDSPLHRESLSEGIEIVPNPDSFYFYYYDFKETKRRQSRLERWMCEIERFRINNIRYKRYQWRDYRFPYNLIIRLMGYLPIKAYYKVRKSYLLALAKRQKKKKISLFSGFNFLM